MAAYEDLPVCFIHIIKITENDPAASTACTTHCDKQISIGCRHVSSQVQTLMNDKGVYLLQWSLSRVKITFL